MYPWSTAFKWHKKLDLPPRQEVESFIHRHVCLQYPNVATLISLVETEGIPKKALCVPDSVTSTDIIFLFKKLSPISPTVGKWLPQLTVSQRH